MLWSTAWPVLALVNIPLIFCFRLEFDWKGKKNYFGLVHRQADAMAPRLLNSLAAESAVRVALVVIADKSHYNGIRL